MDEAVVQHLDGLAKELHCPICLNVMDIPVARLPCCHYFCKECIADGIHHSPACPVCKSKATRRDIASDPTMDRIVQAFKNLEEHRDQLIQGAVALSQQRDHHDMLGSAIPWLRGVEDEAYRSPSRSLSGTAIAKLRAGEGEVSAALKTDTANNNYNKNNKRSKTKVPSTIPEEEEDQSPTMLTETGTASHEAHQAVQNIVAGLNSVEPTPCVITVAPVVNRPIGRNKRPTAAAAAAGAGAGAGVKKGSSEKENRKATTAVATTKQQQQQQLDTNRTTSNGIARKRTRDAVTVSNVHDTIVVAERKKHAKQKAKKSRRESDYIDSSLPMPSVPYHDDEDDDNVLETHMRATESESEAESVPKQHQEKEEEKNNGKRVMVAVEKEKKKMKKKEEEKKKENKRKRGKQEEEREDAHRRIPTRLLPWNCGVCTFENKGTETKCSICATAKGGATPPPATINQQTNTATPGGGVVAAEATRNTGGGGGGKEKRKPSKQRPNTTTTTTTEMTKKNARKTGT